MTYYKIRLKDHPDHYVGKAVTWGLRTHEEITDRGEWRYKNGHASTPAEGYQYWYDWIKDHDLVKERAARIWTNVGSVRRVAGLSRRDKSETFPQYELVIEETGIISIVPLDSVLK